MNRLVISRLLALFVGLACIVLAYNHNKSSTYQVSGPIYGTYWKLVSTEYISDTLKQSIQSELDRIDLIASNYKVTSELSAINRLEIYTELSISSEMASILSYAEELYVLTNGYYDVTLGSLVIDAGFGPKSTVVINPLSISINRFDLKNDNTLIKNDNFQFDLSSIAKGYAVDAISNLLINANKKNYLIDIGGEIIGSGTKHGSPWAIGIQDPTSLNNSAILEILSSDFIAVATSGEYRNFRLSKSGLKVTHTINPMTQKSIQNKVLSVTVISDESSMIADAWATAMNVLGPDAGIVLANKQDIAVMYIMQGNERNFIKSDAWKF